MREDVSLLERGILISIILMKEDDPAMTYAKVRAKIKMNKYQKEFVSLQDKGFITWDGHSRYKKQLQNQDNCEKVEEVINFMNNLYKRRFDYKSKTTIRSLQRRLEKYDVETIKNVVANRYAEWKDSEKMERYLHPVTIFRESKFERYLEEFNRTKAGISFVNDDKITIGSNEKITINNCEQLANEDVYIVKIYDLFEGERISHRVQKLTGERIKNLCKIQQKRIDRKEGESFHYIYTR